MNLLGLGHADLSGPEASRGEVIAPTLSIHSRRSIMNSIKSSSDAQDRRSAQIKIEARSDDRAAKRKEQEAAAAEAQAEKRDAERKEALAEA
jgi:hypothetical protein